MKIFKNFRPVQTLIAASAVAFSLLLLQACGVTDNDHDHTDAVGFVLVQGGNEILRYENNTPTWNPDEVWDVYFRDGIEALILSPDVVNLSGDEPSGMTPLITVRWIGPSGTLFDIHDEDEYRLNWEFEKDLVTGGVNCTSESREDLDSLNDIQPANIEQHSSDPAWQFHFRADHAGEDRFRIRLAHGGHDDFASLWIPIIVTDDEHPLIDENGIYQHVRNKCRVDRP